MEDKLWVKIESSKKDLHCLINMFERFFYEFLLDGICMIKSSNEFGKFGLETETNRDLKNSYKGRKDFY